MKTLNWHLGLGALLLIACMLLSYDMYRLNELMKSEKQLENILKVLIVVGSGLGSLYLLMAKHRSDAENIILKEYAAGYVKREIQPALDKIDLARQTHELLLTEDAARRNERRELLKDFSKTFAQSYRKFRDLIKNCSKTDSEGLVAHLTLALQARESFTTSRDLLLAMQGVHPRHRPIIQEYSNLLVDIIIDVGRPEIMSEDQRRNYVAKMTAHSDSLETRITMINSVLRRFIGPIDTDVDLAQIQ